LRINIHQAFLSQLGSDQHQHKSWLTNDIQSKLTLDETAQDTTSSLQQRMTDDNLEETLQSLAPLLNNGVVEFVKVNLSRKRGDGDAGAFTFEDVAEVFKVGVTTADTALAELKTGNVCRESDLISCIARRGCEAVCLRVAHLVGSSLLAGTHVASLLEIRRTSISRKFSGGP